MFRLPDTVRIVPRRGRGRRGHDSVACELCERWAGIGAAVL